MLKWALGHDYLEGWKQTEFSLSPKSRNCSQEDLIHQTPCTLPHCQPVIDDKVIWVSVRWPGCFLYSWTFCRRQGKEVAASWLMSCLSSCVLFFVQIPNRCVGWWASCNPSSTPLKGSWNTVYCFTSCDRYERLSELWLSSSFPGWEKYTVIYVALIRVLPELRRRKVYAP